METHEKGHYPCPECDKICTNPGGIDNVLRFNLFTLNWCTLCLIFNPWFKAALYRHNLNYHTTRSDEYPCSKCDRKFTVKSHLEQHIESVHLVDPRSCELCGKLFDNPQKLKNHIKNVHSGVQKKPKKVDKSDWTCPTCGKIVATYLKWNHLQIHKEPKYTCDICGKKIKTKTCFDQHMNIHMNVLDHRCEPCNKVSLCCLVKLKYF